MNEFEIKMAELFKLSEEVSTSTEDLLASSRDLLGDTNKLLDLILLLEEDND